MLRGERFVQSFWGGELPPHRYFKGRISRPLDFGGNQNDDAFQTLLFLRWGSVLDPHREIGSNILFGSRGVQIVHPFQSTL